MEVYVKVAQGHLYHVAHHSNTVIVSLENPVPKGMPVRGRA